MAKYKPRDGSVKFKDAIKDMSNKERFNYIWEYYKWWMLSSIAIGFAIFYTIHTSRPTTYLHIAVTSGFSHTGHQFQLGDLDHVDEEIFKLGGTPPNPYGFWVDTAALSTTLEQLLLDDAQHDDYTVITQYLPINFETIPVFATLSGAGELDIVIAYQHDFEAMESIGHFSSIRDLDLQIPAHAFINDHGILLRYLPILNDYIHPSHDDMEIILAVMIGTSRTDEIENFLNQLFK